jgi:hypothetical protein
MNYDLRLILISNFALNWLSLVDKHGRPQTFFQGRAKIFQGGQEPTFCLKNN